MSKRRPLEKSPILEDAAPPEKQESQGELRGMDQTGIKDTSIVLHDELLKFRHEDKEGFLLLVAKMVNELIDSDFKEIAGRNSSWPINVPVKKTPRKIPKHFEDPSDWQQHRNTREAWCKYVLDDLQCVGSRLLLNLRPRNGGISTNAMTSLALECINMIDGVRFNPGRIIFTEAAHGSDRRKFDNWVSSVISMEASGASETEWSELAFEYAQLRFGENLEDDTIAEQWLHGMEASNDAILRTKTAKGRIGYFKKHFKQAFKALTNKAR